MSLVVAGMNVSGVEPLSGAAQLVLALIDGGQQWVAWAAGTPQVAYAFADELALLSGIQQGLHATPLMLLPRLGLLVAPERLMALPFDALRRLALGESGDIPAAEVAAALSSQGLATSGDLAAVDALLAEFGIAAAPLFQAMALGDRLALLSLARELAASDAADADARKQAAAFAVDWARSPDEFADYFRAWLAIATGADAITKPDAARAALETLLPLAFGALDCPSVAGPAGPEQLAAAVAAWHRAGRRVGFARLSLAVAQLVAHGGFRGQTGQAAQALVDSHVDQAQALLAATLPAGARLRQDGALALYDFAGDGAEAVLGLDASGMITVQSFRPKPAA